MKEANFEHDYVYDIDSGTIEDCFGDKMKGVDDFIDEMNFLISELREAKEEIARLEKKFF